MRGALTVASRELVERRNVFVAAAVVAVLPFLAPFASWLGGSNPAELREVVALTLATAFAAALALGYGAAMISGELKERRLGFYFARPLSGLAIWGGKLLAGVVLVWVAPAIVLIPTWLASPSSGPWSSMGDAWLLLVIAAAAVFLLALVHAIGIALRARSPWLVVDVVTLVVVALLVRSMALRLLDEGATDAWKWTLSGLLVAVPVAVVVAGAVQVASGRTDLRRGHRLLSLTLWIPLLTVSLVGQGYSWWVVHPTLADLRGATELCSATRGNWMAFSGRAQGRGDYYPGFLLDVRTGRSVRLGRSDRWHSQLAFSADGRHAAWLGAGSPGERGGWAELKVADLDQPEPQPRTTLISFPASVYPLRLSPDGSRVAAIETGTLSVSAIASGALLASVRLPDGRAWTGAIWFVDNETLRFCRFEPSSADGQVGAVIISEFDVAGRRLRDTGRIEPARLYDWVFLQRDPKADRLLWRTRTPGAPGLSLREGATGRLLAELAPPADGWRGSAAFLSDGTIAVAESKDGRLRLRILTAAAEPLWSLDLGPGDRAKPAGEIAPGKLLVVASSRETWSPGNARTWVVDLHARDAERLPAGSVPLAWMPLTFDGGRLDPEPDSAATRTFLTSDYGLVAFDPVTGTTRMLVAGEPAFSLFDP